MCQAFTRSFGGLFGARFVLGLVEGPLYDFHISALG